MYTIEQLNAISSAIIGLEFEFFSKLKVQETQESLSRLLNKKIRIETKAHSDFNPTGNIFKLEPDNSGGSGMIELVTGPLPFIDSKLIIAKMFKWITENGSTNDKCSIQINISFDKNKVKTNIHLPNLDIGKFVLSFDEDVVYDTFPNRKDSVYAKSIKHIFPLNGMTKMSHAASLWNNYLFVNEKYYGVNFTKLSKNYIEFRYLGGTDYHLKYNDVMKMVHHFIVSLYDTLKNPTYNNEDLYKLQLVLNKHKSVMTAFKSYDNFKLKFPHIKLLVDLTESEQAIKLYYPKIRNGIFEILTKGGMTRGVINYDSDTSRLQIKDAKLLKCFEIIGIDIVDSEIQGNILNCDIFNSKIINSSLTECNVFGGSSIFESKVQDSYISKNVPCKNSYIFGRQGIFSGKMEGGIFRHGRATKLATFSKNAEIIEIEKI